MLLYNTTVVKEELLFISSLYLLYKALKQILGFCESSNEEFLELA
jgi:hypothetical protein